MRPIARSGRRIPVSQQAPVQPLTIPRPSETDIGRFEILWLNGNSELLREGVPVRDGLAGSPNDAAALARSSPIRSGRARGKEWRARSEQPIAGLVLELLEGSLLLLAARAIRPCLPRGRGHGHGQLFSIGS